MLIEFKRPQGGRTPSVEIMGQICFAAAAGRKLEKHWHIVLVPGPDAAAVQSPAQYVAAGIANLERAQKKWNLREDTLADMRASSVEHLAAHVHVLGWERRIALTLEAIRATVPDSWTKRQVLRRLVYFLDSRKELGLFSAEVIA